MQNKYKLILLPIGICLIAALTIGLSYAFFLADVDNTSAKNTTVKSGVMALTFTDTDDAISLLDVKPGNSDTKQFTVENTGTLDVTYNIKFTNASTSFLQHDLIYTIEETDSNFTPKENGRSNTGFINTNTISNNEMYLLLDIPIKPGKENMQYYKLTINFQYLDTDQNYNQEAEFRARVNADDNGKALLYDPLQDNPMYQTIASNKDQTATDDFGNIRYVGADPNNYIWFNCNDYTKVTDKETAVTQQCELWRIIGLMKNIEKEDGNKENLVKIVRAEDIGKKAWDSANTNNWETASLQKTLNGTDTSGYLNPSYNQNSVKGITANTNNMIETVVWNLGGTPNYDTEKTEGFYNAEKGDTTYNGQPTIWTGKIGLIYPSDYGYATSGNSEGTNRETCLGGALYNWNSGAYQTDCAGNDYLLRSGWTLAPITNSPNRVFRVISSGFVDVYLAYTGIEVRPSLYLTSNVKIKGEGGNGSADEPYILVS